MKFFLSLFAVSLFVYSLNAMELKDEIIYLNIGGYKIDITRSTIDLSGGEFLKTLLSGKFAINRDRNGRVFIDRPKEEGKLIQYFMRCLSLPENFDRNVANHAAEFFLIEKMKEYVQQHPGKEKSFQIFFQELYRSDERKIITLRVQNTTRIYDIKRKLAPLVGVSVDKLRLGSITSAEYFEDNKILGDYEVEEQATLKFVRTY